MTAPTPNAEPATDGNAAILVAAGARRIVTPSGEAVWLIPAEASPYGSGCSCDYLGEGTPEHTPGAFCPGGEKP